MLSGCCATSHGRGIDISSPPLKSASRLQTRSVCATSCGREADCRVLAELRHAPSTAADPTELRVRRQAHPPPPSQRAVASDARGRRSGRRPGVCLVLSSSAGARCAVVSSNATLFPPLEHSAGGGGIDANTHLCVAFRLFCDSEPRSGVACWGNKVGGCARSDLVGLESAQSQSQLEIDTPPLRATSEA